MFQFSDILGQNEVKSSLIKQANSGKLHHAHLFLGKMGYGSFQIAMAFVKYIYCTQKQEADSCDQCPNCSKINKLSHIDIHFTLPSFDKDHLSKELIPNYRQLIEDTDAMFDLKDWQDFNNSKNSKIRSVEFDKILYDMGLTSYEDGYKTQIIWMAEYMEKESNKILKILEEPNPKTLFILVAENSDRLLPTILSRCNIHKIPPLKSEEVSNHIRTYLPNLNSESVSRIVQFAEGNIIEAKRFAEDEDSSFPLEANLLDFLRGLINFHARKFDNINKAILQAEVIAAQSKPNQKKFLEFFQYFLRQVILIKFNQKGQLSDNLLKAGYHFAKSLDIDQIETWALLIDKYHYAIDGNANVKISFVSLAIESGKLQDREEYKILVSQ